MSAICCPLSEYDAGGNEFYHDATRKARKQHKCCECHRVIEPRETYQRAAGKSDGNLWNYSTCFLCAEIREHFQCGRGWLFGSLWEDLGENFIPEMVAGGPCLEGLSAAAKERLFEEWRRWRGLRGTDEN